jgi:hypothetical protein
METFESPCSLLTIACKIRRLIRKKLLCKLHNNLFCVLLAWWWFHVKPKHVVLSYWIYKNSCNWRLLSICVSSRQRHVPHYKNILKFCSYEYNKQSNTNLHFMYRNTIWSISNENILKNIEIFYCRTNNFNIIGIIFVKQYLGSHISQTLVRTVLLLVTLHTSCIVLTSNYSSQ